VPSKRANRKSGNDQRIDRYYTQRFLERHRNDICGRVLELTAPGFGPLDQASVGELSVTEWRSVELDADSAVLRALPLGAYEAIVLLGAGRGLFDLEALIKEASRALAPGGIMLAALPCVAPIDPARADYWRFTPSLAKRMFEAHFGLGQVEAEGLGNALAASAILTGRVVGDLTKEELDRSDVTSPVVVGVRAARPSWSPTDEVDLSSLQARYPYLYENPPSSEATETEFGVTAVISSYNEADIIGTVISHLVENGLDVYLIDNHSTDDTVAVASRWLGRGLVGIETFPEGSESHEHFPWEAILARKIFLTRRLGSTWVMHHDADEIRESPWPGVTLRDAIRWVDQVGYNAIGFRPLNFPPVDDRFTKGMDPRAHFMRWEDVADYDRVQVKCWKIGADDVELADGGHEVRFSQRRVFPIPFILRHYPVRGQTHGLRKVLTERKNRFLESELERGWHVQYDSIKDESHQFLRNPASLRPFDLDLVRMEVMLSGMDLPPPKAPGPPEPSSRAEGFLDHVGHDRITGWAWSGDPEDEPVNVDIWDGGHLLGTVRAHRFRPDLRAAGKGSGHAGFEFVPPPSLDDGGQHTIWANHSGTSVSLRRSPRGLAPRER